MDSKRVNGATTQVIKSWFSFLALPEIQQIKPSNRWNMDEAGFIEGQGDNGLVIGSAQSKSVKRKDSGSRLWTSFIECISASGQSLLPLVIFEGKSVQQQCFPLQMDVYKDWLFTATDNAWTDN